MRATITARCRFCFKAREQTPRHADLLYALGECYARLDRPREAVEAFDAGLAVAQEARLHFARALALEDLRELDAARSALEQAVKLEPAHAEALGTAGFAGGAAGRCRIRPRSGRRALAIDPRHATARIALAHAALEQKDMATAEAQVSALVQDPSLGAVNRAYALSLAGDILDAQERFPEAFAAYAVVKGGATRRVCAANGGCGKRDPARAKAGGVFSPPPMPRFGARRDNGGGAHTHVFLVGFPRSGTTLLEQVLASHPDVMAMDERTCLMDSAAEFFGSNADLDRLAAMPDHALEPWRQAYWKRVAESGFTSSKPVFIDKMPLNAVFLPLIAKLFPRAKILFALRDPRDVVLSCFRRRFAMNAGMYEFTSLETTTAYYGAVMRLIEVYRQKLALDLAETRHESLVTDFENEARRICDFLGLEFRDQMRAFARRAQGQNIDTPSGAQVARGLSSEGLAQWRRYAVPLSPALPWLAPFVTRFGYPEN